jgi:hypothetical protein
MTTATDEFTADAADRAAARERRTPLTNTEHNHIFTLKTTDGTQYGSVKLVEDTLTDGSKVYNLVLMVG